MAKWITFIIAGIGLMLGLYTVATSYDEPPPPPVARPPSVNPFPRGIAASGIVEASSRNVAVDAPEPGLVVAVHVQVNDAIKQGQPLFQLDPRALESERVRARSAQQRAKAELDRLRAMPRPEDLPPLEAAVRQEQARANEARDEHERAKSIRERNATTEWEVVRLGHVRAAAEARLQESLAALARAKAGAWEREIQVAQASLSQADADVQALQLRLDRLTVRSPIDGTVLKRNVEPGQYASGEPSRAAMVVGDLRNLHIRAQVDEEDSPLLRAGAKGIARLRGSLDRQHDLTMLRIEPLALPKSQLTDRSTERVDTRVIEVVFELTQPGQTPFFPGQLVDVFIDTAASDEPRP